MDKVVHISVPLTEFLQAIGSVVDEKLESNYQKQLEEKLLNSSDVTALFDITKATLNNWINDGKIKVHIVKNGRNYFKHHEVMDSLKEGGKHSRKPGKAIQQKGRVKHG